MTDYRLDSPAACMNELSAINVKLGEFGFKWAEDAGQLKGLESRQERLYRAALRGLKGHDLTVQEKAAAAHAAVEELEPDLAERIEGLEGEVEKYKTRFKVLERRAGNAQSILAALRAEARLESGVQPSWTGRQAA